MSLSCDETLGTCSFAVKDTRPRPPCPAGQGCQPVPLTTASSEQKSWMGTLNFPGGSYVSTANDPFAGTLTILLNGSNPGIFIFTDRPYREGFTVQAKEFANHFAETFTTATGGFPNAYIALPDDENLTGGGLYFFEITSMEPRTIPHDDDPNQVAGLELLLSIVESVPTGEVKPDYDNATPAQTPPPTTFVAGNLFIDGWFSDQWTKLGDLLNNGSQAFHSAIHGFSNPQAMAAALGDWVIPRDEIVGSCFRSRSTNPDFPPLPINLQHVQTGDTQGYFRRAIVNSGGGLRACYSSYGMIRGCRKSIQLISHSPGSSTEYDSKQVLVCRPDAPKNAAGRRAFYEYGAGMYGISGGSWAAGSYCYSPKSDDDIFGKPWTRRDPPQIESPKGVAVIFGSRGKRGWDYFLLGVPGSLPAVKDSITGDALVESYAEQIQEAIMDTVGLTEQYTFLPMGDPSQEKQRTRRCRPHPNIGFVNISRAVTTSDKNCPLMTCDGPLYGRTTGTFGSSWLNTPTAGQATGHMTVRPNDYCVNKDSCDHGHTTDLFSIGGRMSNNIFNHRWYNNKMLHDAYQGGFLLMATPHPKASAFEADLATIWGGAEDREAGASLLRAATYSSWAPGAVLQRAGHIVPILTTSMDESFQSSYISPDYLIVDPKPEDGTRAGQTSQTGYWVDGGVAQNIPTPAAIRNGCMDQTSDNWLAAGQEGDLQVLYIQSATSGFVDWSKDDPLEHITDVRSMFQGIQTTDSILQGTGRYAQSGQYQSSSWVFEQSDYADVQKMLLATYATGFGMFAKKVCTVASHPMHGLRSTGESYAGQKVLVYLFALSPMPAWEAAVGKYDPDITTWLHNVNTLRHSTTAGTVVGPNADGAHAMFDTDLNMFPNFSTLGHLRYLEKTAELIMQQETFKFIFWMRRSKTALPFPGAGLNFSAEADVDTEEGIVRAGAFAKLPVTGQYQVEINTDEGPPSDLSEAQVWANNSGSATMIPWSNPELIYNYARKVMWLSGVPTGHAAAGNNFLAYSLLAKSENKLGSTTLHLQTVDGADPFNSIRLADGNGPDGKGANPTNTKGIENGPGYDASHRHAFPNPAHHSFAQMRRMVYMLYQSADQTNTVQVGCTDSTGNYLTESSWAVLRDYGKTMTSRAVTMALDGYHEDVMEGGYSHDFGNYGFASVPFVPLHDVPTTKASQPDYMNGAISPTVYPLNSAQNYTLVSYWGLLSHPVRDQDLDSWLDNFEVANDPILLTLAGPIGAVHAVGTDVNQLAIHGSQVGMTGKIAKETQNGDTQLEILLATGQAYAGQLVIGVGTINVTQVHLEGSAPTIWNMELKVPLDPIQTVQKGWDIQQDVQYVGATVPEGTVYETSEPGQRYLRIRHKAGSGAFYNGTVLVYDGVGNLQSTLLSIDTFLGQNGSPYNEHDVRPMSTTGVTKSPWKDFVHVPAPLGMSGYVTHKQVSGAEIHLELSQPGVTWRPQLQIVSGPPVFTNNPHLPVPIYGLTTGRPWDSLPAHALPGVPQNVVGTSIATGIRIQWNEPASIGGGPVTKYRVDRATDSAGTPGTWTHNVWTGFSSSQGSAPLFLVELSTAVATPGVDYWYRVSAYNVSGWGPAATTSSTVAAT